MVAYGWVVNEHTNVSIALILHFMQGFWGTCFYTIYNTLSVHIFPQSPSTVAAAASIVRCSMAAAGVAILQPLLDAVSHGWYCTTLALLSCVIGAWAIWTIKKHGMRWSVERITKNKAGDFTEPAASDSIPKVDIEPEIEENMMSQTCSRQLAEKG
jgi:hypothetical protein